jgi:hypothetical protein
MGDIDQPDSLRFEAADDREQVGGFAFRQRCGRLIENQQARLAGERPRDFNELLLGHREAADFFVGIDPRADLVQNAGCCGAAEFPAHGLPEPRELGSQGDILGHRQIGKQGRLLVNHGDAEPAGPVRIEILQPVSGEIDLAVIGLFGPADDFDQRGLARPVLTDQGMHFAGMQIERDAAQRLHAAERSGNTGQFQEQRRRGHVARQLIADRARGVSSANDERR